MVNEAQFNTIFNEKKKIRMQDIEERKIKVIRKYLKKISLEYLSEELSNAEAIGHCHVIIIDEKDYNYEDGFSNQSLFEKPINTLLTEEGIIKLGGNIDQTKSVHSMLRDILPGKYEIYTNTSIRDHDRPVLFSVKVAFYDSFLPKILNFLCFNFAYNK